MNNPNDVFSMYFQKSGENPSITTNQGKLSPVSKPKNISQRANANSDMESFTDTFKTLLDDTWDDGWGVFTVESPTGNDPNSVALPSIIFSVVERKPSKNKAGLKGRPFEMHLDPDNEDYTIILSRKWFDCEVEFLITHRTNREASQLMTKLELFIEAYVGYFKQQGLSEMIFIGESKSKLSNKSLEGIPSKCLSYLIVLERISTVRVRTTKEIRSQIEANTPTNQE